MYNPALGTVQREVRLASTRRCRRRRRLATAAWAQWRDSSIAKRQTVLFAFRELLNARKQELAEILTSEHGKVLSDALGEIARGMEVVEFACGLGHLTKGAYSENVSTGIDVYTLRSRSASWASSARSTSPPWCRCGSSRSRSPPATR